MTPGSARRQEYANAKPGFLARIGVWSALAFALNLAWVIAHAPLYTFMGRRRNPSHRREGAMRVETDALKGQAVGSLIRVTRISFSIRISNDVGAPK